MHFASYKKLVAEWKDRDYLKCDKDRIDTTEYLGDKRRRVIYFKDLLTL